MRCICQWKIIFGSEARYSKAVTWNEKPSIDGELFRIAAANPPKPGS
jgi:hypothetical protein